MMTSQVENELEIRMSPTPEEAGAAAALSAASAVRQLLSRQAEVRLVFAAAASQTHFLNRLCEDNSVDWSRVTAFHLDEYLGLPSSHEALFGQWLRRHLFDRVTPRRVEYMNSDCVDPTRECERYAALVTASPIDIGFLGIGENGHLAFNEPDVADFEDPSVVSVVELEVASRRQQVHDGAFGRLADVPRRALTLTIPTIMACRQLSVVVTGRQKAVAVDRTLHDRVNEICPATFLRRHRFVSLYVDANAMVVARRRAPVRPTSSAAS